MKIKTELKIPVELEIEEETEAVSIEVDNRKVGHQKLNKNIESAVKNILIQNGIKAEKLEKVHCSFYVSFPTRFENS